MPTWLEVRGPCTYGNVWCVLPRGHIGGCIDCDEAAEQLVVAAAREAAHAALAEHAYVAYTAPMDATAEDTTVPTDPLKATPEEAAAEANGRMWRKVVAFRRDQEDSLKDAARNHPADPGNVSAVIRDAVDRHLQIEHKEG